MIHHALENPTRRRMIIIMNQGCLSISDIAQSVGALMLDYHLNRLELAGLIEVQEGSVILTESGKAYGSLVKAQAEKGGADKL